MSTGDNGGGFNITDVNYFAFNHQPYADEGTNNNLTEELVPTTGGIVQITGGANVSGVVTATSFSGDGSNLTNVGGSIPSGGIIIWSGASNAIPTGWYLCDGQNSTPDLEIDLLLVLETTMLLMLLVVVQMLPLYHTLTVLVT